LGWAKSSQSEKLKLQSWIAGLVAAGAYAVLLPSLPGAESSRYALLPPFLVTSIAGG
jgi:hypothetical protein